MDDDRHARLAEEPPDEDTRRLNEALRAAGASGPAQSEADIALLRQSRARGVTLLPEAEERFVESQAGRVKLRIFLPRAIERIYVHLHDGAWALGGAHMQDWLLRGLANRCSAVVASVDYRLAPEHPYPAAPDDAEAAALWFVQHGMSEFGSDCLMIGGESAGAHLAVTTLLRMRDRHQFSGFRAANLNYGCYDLGLTPSARNFGDRTLMIDTPSVERFTTLFAAGRDPRDPDLSPLYADLHDLPHALFTVGTLDPFLDDSLLMHDRWTAAGNRSELALYPGCPHAFSFFPIAAARRSFEQQVAFLSQPSRGSSGV